MICFIIFSLTNNVYLNLIWIMNFIFLIFLNLESQITIFHLIHEHFNLDTSVIK